MDKNKPIWQRVHPKVLDSMARIQSFSEAIEDYTRRKAEAEEAYARYLDQKSRMTEFDLRLFEYIATGKVTRNERTSSVH